MPRWLVTGGAGFIGSNFIRLALAERPDIEIVNLDKLTYAGNLENLREVERNPRYRFVPGDIGDASIVNGLVEAGLDTIFNFAAESHVDRSIEDPAGFLETNVRGAQVLLEAARRQRMPRFVQISTDEVYGSLPEGAAGEASPLQPSSPYAASKAAADLLVRSYIHTYGLPAIITRSTNNYGPYQFPEKLIPLMIANALEDKPLPVYGDGMNVRDWVHVEDHCRALLLVAERGGAGEIYNIGGVAPLPNLEVIETILKILSKPRSLIRFVEDRPGHDRRYAVDSSKIRRELGWQPVAAATFDEGIRETVEWYLAHRDWVDHVRSGAYRSYYERHYERRAATLAEWRGEPDSGERPN